MNNSKCSFCENEPENMQHLFWECTVVQQFWKSFEHLLHSKCGNVMNMQLTQEIVLFGNAENFESDDVIDFLILFAKFYIYKCRLDKRHPEISLFVILLIARFRIEKYMSYVNMNYDEFQWKWMLYMPLLENDD